MEAHCGFRFTMEQVNEHRRQQGLEGVSRYCVMSVFHRLKPKIDILQKIVSGGHNQACITVRHNVTKQMQVMLGKLTREDLLQDSETGLVCEGPLPHWLEPDHLPKLSDAQIAWWDECHIEQQGGKVGNKMYQYLFRRDENGNLSDNGTYKTDLLTKISFKYPEQGRFSFGVAKVKSNNSPLPKGICLPSIDYTMRNIVTIEVYKKHQQEEIRRVRHLTGTKLTCWNISLRPKGALWMEDPVKLIPGAGGKKGQSLVDAGVATIASLQNNLTKELIVIQQTITGISLPTLHKWRSTTASPGSSPDENKDYRKFPNPYLEMYGADDWEKKINESMFMRKYTCITTLVKEIHDSSQAAFVETKHEGYCFFTTMLYRK